MPFYTVLERSYINDRLVEPGTVIEYTAPMGKDEDGKPSPTKIGPNLHPAKAGAVPTMTQAEADLAKAQAEIAAAQANSPA